jgi:hypothetical protein
VTGSVLQESQTSIGGTGQTTLTRTLTFTAGSTAVAICGGPSGTSHTITDSVNGATGWTQALALTTVGGGGVRIFYRNSMAAGSTVITDTYGGSTAFTGLWIVEIGGTSGFDVATTMTTSSTGTARTSPSGTPTVQPGLCLGVIYNDTGGSSTVAATAGTGFTISTQGWDFGSTPLHMATEVQRYTSTAALPATFTVTSGNSTGTTALFFKEAASGTAYTLPVTKANVPVVGESVNLVWSGAAHPYTLSVGTALVPILMGQAFADYALGVSVLSVPVVGETVGFIYTPAGHNAYVLPVVVRSVPVVGESVGLLYTPAAHPYVLPVAMRPIPVVGENVNLIWSGAPISGSLAQFFARFKSMANPIWQPGTAGTNAADVVATISPAITFDRFTVQALTNTLDVQVTCDGLTWVTVAVQDASTTTPTYLATVAAGKVGFLFGRFLGVRCRQSGASAANGVLIGA